MTLILYAIALLAFCIVCMALLALLRPTEQLTRLADFLGPAGAAIACIVGLFGLFELPFEATTEAVIPWGLPFGAGLIGLDAFTRAFLMPVWGLGLVCALSGGFSLRHTNAQEHNLASHWLFYLLLVFGMTLVMLARDAVLFLIAWEVMSVSPFFLIDFNDSDRTVRDVSWLYLVAAHIGAVLLLVFFGLLWQSAESAAFTKMHLSSLEGTFPSVLFLLAFFGFGAKAGVAPMHIWLPEAHPAAPSHISAILSGAMINAGLYGIIRACMLLGDLQTAPAWWGWCALFLGVATALMGILKALAQHNLKRLLAYSSIENMGLMLTGVGAWLIGCHTSNVWIATLGLGGAVFHMLNHSAFKGLLFLAAGEVLHATGTVHMDKLGGLQKRMPLVGALFGIGAASIACFPPFNGFAGEFVLALTLLGGFTLPGVEQQIGMLFVLVVLGIISGFACATYAKAYGITFLGGARTHHAEHIHCPKTQTLWPLVIPALCCLLGGLFAGDSFLTFIAHLDPGLDNMHTDQVNPLMYRVATMLDNIALAGWILLGVVIFFWLLRRVCIGQRLRQAETWGCGYQFGTARVQYTDAGFVEPLAKLFGKAMGLKVSCKTDSRYFPVLGALKVTAPDRLRTGFYTPFFEYVERFCNACKIIQHGKIHLYILYILATLIALLVWGLHA